MQLGATQATHSLHNGQTDVGQADERQVVEAHEHDSQIQSAAAPEEGVHKASALLQGIHASGVLLWQIGLQPTACCCRRPALPCMQSQ